MAIRKKSVGRPKMKGKDKVQRIPISAPIKHHKAIKEEFEPSVKSFVEKLDSPTINTDKP